MTGMNVVQIDTPEFKARALHIGELPAVKVMMMMNEKQPAQQLQLLLDTIKSALIDQNQVQILEGLSFDQLLAVAKQYVDLKPTMTDLSEF